MCFTRDLPQEGPKKEGDHRTDAENNEEENYEEDEEETEGDAAGRDKRTNRRAEMWDGRRLQPAAGLSLPCFLKE